VNDQAAVGKLDFFRSPEQRAQFIATYDAVLADWPVPYEEVDVDTDAGVTHVIACGPSSAPPLILLHGATTTAVMWRPVIEALSASYRCYCVDTITEPNKSMPTRRVFGVSKLVGWLRQVLTALGVPASARVAGFSYGGWMAANLAVHAPELVNRLVLLAPAATFAPIPVEFYFRVFSPGPLRSPAMARKAVQWLSSTPGASLDPTLDLALTNLVSGRFLRLGVPSPTVLKDDTLRRINAPTTVLIGDRDVIYRGGPRAALARAQKLIPNVAVSALPGANHWLTVDCPRRLADELVLGLT
jgi:pimeloyl-ACP methyl ester carboxylesterase